MKAEEELQFLNEKDLSDHAASDMQYHQPTTSGLAVLQEDNPTGSTSPIGFIRKSKHPTAAVFHLLFKTLAVLTYVFSGMFTDNFIFVCVLCIILLAFDFWTVKNVTGRLLVGLRWWNYVKEDGTNEWVFESLENPSEVSANDSRVFWWGLYIPVVVWGALLFIDILKLNLQWLIVVFIALSVHIANIVGYTKCSSDAKARMKNLVDQGQAGLGMLGMLGQSSAFQSLFSGMFGGGSGGTAGGSSATPTDIPMSRMVWTKRVGGFGTRLVPARPSDVAALLLSWLSQNNV